jgi:hypothetical protein
MPSESSIWLRRERRWAMKLTTLRAPAELVLEPTLVVFLAELELVDALAELEFELGLELEPVAGAAELDVEPDIGSELGVAELDPAVPVGVVEVGDPFPVLAPELDAPAPVVGVPPASVGLPAVPGAAPGAAELTGRPLVAFEPVAAGAVVGGRFCGEYMSGSSSIVIGVARMP